MVAVLALGGALTFVLKSGGGAQTRQGSVVKGAGQGSADGGTKGGSGSPGNGSTDSGAQNSAPPSKSPDGDASDASSQADTAPAPATEPKPEPEPEVAQGRKLQPGKPIRDQVEAEAGCERTIYASTLLGMREFDAKFLTTTTREECRQMMTEAFGGLNPDGDVEDDLALVRIIDINRATQRTSDPDHKSLYDSRPLIVVKFKGEGLPEGVRVTVYAEVPANASKLIQAKPTDVVSCGENIPLATEGPDVKKECCDLNRDTDYFEVPLDLRWNDDELRKLKQPFTFTLTMHVRYQDGSQDTVTAPVTIRPAAEVEFSYPIGLAVGTLVDEGHPWVHRIINEVNQDPDNKRRGVVLKGAGGDEAGAVMSMFQIWKYLTAIGVRYQVLGGADGEAQRIRMVHETLKDRNGCCIDGTVLLASFVRALELECFLVWRPSHIYLSYRKLGSNTNFLLDSTLINHPEPRYKKLPPADLWYESVPQGESSAFDQLMDRYPFLKTDSAFATFMWGHLAARLDFKKHWVQREELAKQVKGLLGKEGKRSEAEQERLDGLMDALRAQLRWFDVVQMRSLGVKPIGSPTSLNTDYRFPRP